jgi:hypothetical protein
LPYSTYNKRPNAVEEVTLDWLPFIESGVILTSTWPVTPSGITVLSTSKTNTTTTIKLSGGVNGQGYRFVNDITTINGTHEWELMVYLSETTAVPVGPPYASVAEAQAIQPAAQGAEALKVDMVLQQASDWIAKLAPYKTTATATLSEAMDATQNTIPVPKIETFKPSGTVLIDSELIQYQGKLSSASETLYTGVGSLRSALRGRRATPPTTHALGASVTDVDYPLKARNAELALFEWLWETRGYKPSRTGVISSESYSIDPAQIREIIKGTMGSFYTGGAGMKSVPIVSSFPRSNRSRLWIGNA